MPIREGGGLTGQNKISLTGLSHTQIRDRNGKDHHSLSKLIECQGEYRMTWKTEVCNFQNCIVWGPK